MDSAGIISRSMGLSTQIVKPNKPRHLHTCRQCRERRCGCSREDPCSQCVSKGQGSECDWSGSKPVIVHPNSKRVNVQRRLQDEREEIEQRVDQLTQLLRQSSNLERQSSNLGVESDILKSHNLPPVNQNIPTISSELISAQAAVLPTPNAQDQFRSVHGGQYTRDFLNNVDRFVARNTAEKPFMDQRHHSSDSHGSSLLGLGYGPRDVNTLMSKIPSPAQIARSLEGYEKSCAWLHRLLHRPTFWDQVQSRLIRRSEPIEELLRSPDRHYKTLHWIAILFATCGLGLYGNLMNDERCREAQFPIGEADQHQLARVWLQCSTSALILGEHTERPTTESISAMVILAQFPLYFSNQESLALTIDFTSSSINLAKRIQLDLDPDDIPALKNSSDLEKDMRRRLIMAILSQEFKMGGLFCKRSGLQSPHQFHFKNPRDSFDEDYDLRTGNFVSSHRTNGPMQTIMTGVIARYQVGRIWQLIAISFSDVDKSPNYELILNLDEQLREVESHFPSWFRTQFNLNTSDVFPSTNGGNPILDMDRLGTYAVLAGAYIRLHRSYLRINNIGAGLPSANMNLHRQRILYYGRFLLAIQKRTDLYPLKRVPLQFSALAASIALAVYCLTSERDAPECTSLRQELHLVCSVYQPIIQSNPILRRSHGVLVFLLGCDTERLSKTPIESINHQQNQLLPSFSQNFDHQPFTGHSMCTSVLQPETVASSSLFSDFLIPTVSIQDTNTNRDQSFEQSFGQIPTQRRHDHLTGPTTAGFEFPLQLVGPSHQISGSPSSYHLFNNF